MEQIEQEAFRESLNILEGILECPNERVHNFLNIVALCDFVKTFNIQNFNVRTGYLQETGKQVVQLTYNVVNN
ncbi:hypothetical protein D3C85_748970 [compost metagenome]